MSIKIKCIIIVYYIVPLHITHYYIKIFTFNHSTVFLTEMMTTNY